MPNFEAPSYIPPEAREKESSTYEMAARSVKSREHPKHDEDKMFILPEHKAFGVFDGMGGHKGGEVAANIARNFIGEAIEKLPTDSSPDQIESEIKKLIEEANSEILKHATENADVENMGTTATVVKIWEGGQGERKAIIGNAGDSRVYVFHRDGNLEQITIDDSIIRRMGKTSEEMRYIQEKFSEVTSEQDLDGVSEEAGWAMRNQIGQALGLDESLNVRMHTIDIQKGDILLASSDGIHDNLRNSEIQNILSARGNSRELVDKLIAAAHKRSLEKENIRAKEDDKSAIIAEIPSSSIPTTNEDLFVPKLSKGSIVNVKRSSGEIEGGWTIKEYDRDTGQAILTKIRGIDLLQKRASQSELIVWNRSEIRKGDTVRVLRSSGQFEEGWILDGHDSQTGEAIVKKRDPDGQWLEKKVSRDQLESWNKN